jgi:hypothetical protein
MKNSTLKYYLLFVFSSICLKSISQGQLPTNSVTITPTSNTTDVKGSIKASGLVEANSLKASGLATGNPYVANPVYANVDGNLVTGYRLGYHSIPPSAFRLTLYLNTNGEYSSYGPDFLLYDAGSVGSFAESVNRKFVAPVYLPHGAKISEIKIGAFSAYNDSRTLKVSLVQTDFLTRQATTIHEFTTNDISQTNSTVFVSSLNLVLIDNQNFLYQIFVESSTQTWNIVSLTGIIIEYRDM